MRFSDIILFLIIAISLVGLNSCTPKVGEGLQQEDPLTSTEVEEAEDDRPISDCVKFSDSKRKNDALDAYSIYGNFLMVDQYTESFEYWETVYKYAPAGLGREPDVYTDGIMYYDHFYKSTEDPQKKEEYLDKIFQLYEEAIECFPFRKTELIARRAFDYYYNYPERKSKVEMFDEFKYVVNEMAENTPVYTINPMTALVYNGYKDEFIERDTASKYAYKLFNIITANKDNPQNRDQWEIVQNYSLQLLSYLEGEENFYPCAYFQAVYLPLYYENPESCDTVQMVYSQLKGAGCEGLAEFAEMEARLEGECKELDMPEEGSVKAALLDYQEGNFTKAIEGFAAYVERTEDPERKAKVSILIAKIYYSNLRQFPSARTWALRAASYKKNWGEPYILIGKLYASSGSLCGPGTGWDSQIVTWPAIDKWVYARQIDPEAAAEANQLIRQYQKYMPSVADIFARPRINEGDSFRVECWIQETTTVRAAPR